MRILRILKLLYCFRFFLILQESRQDAARSTHTEKDETDTDLAHMSKTDKEALGSNFLKETTPLEKTEKKTIISHEGTRDVELIAVKKTLDSQMDKMKKELTTVKEALISLLGTMGVDSTDIKEILVSRIDTMDKEMTTANVQKEASQVGNVDVEIKRENEPLTRHWKTESMFIGDAHTKGKTCLTMYNNTCLFI